MSLQLYAREADGDDTRPVVFCPYRGLRAFEPEHRRFFFGRVREREETLGDMQALIDNGRPRFIVVYGASGTTFLRLGGLLDNSGVDLRQPALTRSRSSAQNGYRRVGTAFAAICMENWPVYYRKTISRWPLYGHAHAGL